MACRSKHRYYIQDRHYRMDCSNTHNYTRIDKGYKKYHYPGPSSGGHTRPFLFACPRNSSCLRPGLFCHHFYLPCLLHFPLISSLFSQSFLVLIPSLLSRSRERTGGRPRHGAGGDARVRERPGAGGGAEPTDAARPSYLLSSDRHRASPRPASRDMEPAEARGRVRPGAGCGSDQRTAPPGRPAAAWPRQRRAGGCGPGPAAEARGQVRLGPGGRCAARPRRLPAVEARRQARQAVASLRGRRLPAGGRARDFFSFSDM